VTGMWKGRGRKCANQNLF